MNAAGTTPKRPRKTEQAQSMVCYWLKITDMAEHPDGMDYAYLSIPPAMGIGNFSNRLYRTVSIPSLVLFGETIHPFRRVTSP